MTGRPRQRGLSAGPGRTDRRDWSGLGGNRTDGRVESCSGPAPRAPAASPRLALASFRPPHFSCSGHLDFSSLCPALPAAAGWLLPLALPLPDVRSRLAFELDRFRQPPIRNGRTPAQDRQAPRFLVPSQSASLGQARARTITNTSTPRLPPSTVVAMMDRQAVEQKGE